MATTIIAPPKKRLGRPSQIKLHTYLKALMCDRESCKLFMWKAYR